MTHPFLDELPHPPDVKEELRYFYREEDEDRFSLHCRAGAGQISHTDVLVDYHTELMLWNWDNGRMIVDKRWYKYPEDERRVLHRPNGAAMVKWVDDRPVYWSYFLHGVTIPNALVEECLGACPIDFTHEQEVLFLLSFSP